MGGKPVKKQYAFEGNDLVLNLINSSLKENGELKTTISPLLGTLFFKEYFSIINLSLICSSGNMEPEGIYRGSAIKDLHEDKMQAKKIMGNHSIKNSFFVIFIRIYIKLIKFFDFDYSCLLLKDLLVN
tara:strand:+ start:88 stop:471 length:384 start_codon:yes stop_codon:yes gene_type:complete